MWYMGTYPGVETCPGQYGIFLLRCIMPILQHHLNMPSFFRSIRVLEMRVVACYLHHASLPAHQITPSDSGASTVKGRGPSRTTIPRYIIKLMLLAVVSLSYGTGSNVLARPTTITNYTLSIRYGVVTSRNSCIQVRMPMRGVYVLNKGAWRNARLCDRSHYCMPPSSKRCLLLEEHENRMQT